MHPSPDLPPEIAAWFAARGWRARRHQLEMLGADDYYDWKVRRAEGMTKVEVFALLDELERDTRAAGQRAVKALGQKVGADKVTSWNVRSSARKSGMASPVSASTTAASDTPGK